jgi:hypothetical protein
MEGYEVVTPGDETVGKVVEQKGDYVIVEHGLLRKSRHAVPRSMIEVDEGANKARTTVSKEVIADSPEVENGSFDEQAVAQYYGLGADQEAPGTEGYGVTDREDPSWSAEEQGLEAGVMPAEEQRARIREGMEDSTIPDAPALLGDRYADVDEREQRED